MKDLIKRRVIIGKLLIFTNALFVIAFLGATVITVSGLTIFGGSLMLLSAFLAIMSISIYLKSYSKFLQCMKWLDARRLEDTAYDIDPNVITLPVSRMYCGQTALLSKKPWVIIPYSEISWVYVPLDEAISLTLHVLVYTRDNKCFRLSYHPDEFKWLLENYILKHAPDVLLGPRGKEEHKRRVGA